MTAISPVRVADNAMLARAGLIRPGSHFTTDDMLTFDQTSRFTIDSTGAFLVGELERLDPTLHEPLVAVTWSRDIDLREDVTMADESSSYTLSSFASPGGTTPTGKSWIGKESTAVSGVSVDIGKIVNPMFPWGKELRWTLLELESSQRLNRPIDAQKYTAMKLAYQMEVDEMVYVGDTTYAKFGMFNSPLVTPANVANGALGTPQWTTKTPEEMLADVNALLTAAWLASGTAIVPGELRLPPLPWSYLASRIVSQAGNVSVLTYLANNSIANAANGKPLNILPVKWLTGAGAGGTNRMVAYTKNPEFVRFPLVPLQHTPVEYKSIWQATTYYGKLGVVEVVYPETFAYRDGI